MNLKRIYNIPGIRIFEGKVPARKVSGERCTLPFHLTDVDLIKTSISLSVNHLGKDYKWGDATVRGYIDQSQIGWMKQYYDEVNGLLRAKTLNFHVKDFLTSNPQQNVVMATEANGNLFWNLGSWAFVDGILYQHYRERLEGKQTCLILPVGEKPRIGVLDMTNISDFFGCSAVSGQRLMLDFKKIGILDIDPGTERYLSAEFCGDFSVVSRLPFLRSVQLAVFLSNIKTSDENATTDGMSEFSRRIFEQDIGCFLSKTSGLSDLIKKIVLGETATLDVAEDRDEVIGAMVRSGYRFDDFIFDGSTHQLTARFKRSIFGHSIAGIDPSGERLLAFKIYTNNERDGLTIEKSLDSFIAAASTIGFKIKDAILMSSGGDLRIGLCKGKAPPKLLNISSDGENLLYKGGSEYGITSAFIFSRKETF